MIINKVAPLTPSENLVFPTPLGLLADADCAVEVELNAALGSKVTLPLVRGVVLPLALSRFHSVSPASATVMAVWGAL